MDFKLNLTQRFLNLDGKEFLKEDNKTPSTLKDILRMVVTAELPTDTQGNPQDVLAKKMKNWDIYMKVTTAGDEVELTPEEITHIKERAPFILSILILGPLMNLMTGKEAYPK